jgi:hypothetical protein
MTRKYIRQQILQDFVYPNNEVSQYDVDNIVHDINDNSVSGVVNSFSATTFNSTGLTISYNTTWNLNGAEPWIRNSSALGILSVHMLAPTQNYYKPWRVVTSSSNVDVTTLTQTLSFSVTPSQVGLSTFTSGTYYYEVRFIGHRSIYPVCVNLNLTLPSPTPTPTATPTATPTPTGTGSTPTPTITPTATATPTPTETIYSYSGSGRGNNVNDACSDAAINNRTFYSDCSVIGAGCEVYTNSLGTILLTGFTNIFMSGAAYDINSTTGIIIGLSEVQC